MEQVEIVSVDKNNNQTIIPEIHFVLEHRRKEEGGGADGSSPPLFGYFVFLFQYSQTVSPPFKILCTILMTQGADF